VSRATDQTTQIRTAATSALTNHRNARPDIRPIDRRLIRIPVAAIRSHLRMMQIQIEDTRSRGLTTHQRVHPRHPIRLPGAILRRVVTRHLRLRRVPILLRAEAILLLAAVTPRRVVAIRHRVVARVAVVDLTAVEAARAVEAATAAVLRTVDDNSLNYGETFRGPRKAVGLFFRQRDSLASVETAAATHSRIPG